MLRKIDQCVIGKPTNFLGLRITYKVNAIELDQEEYIETVIRKFGILDGCNPVSLPADPGMNLKLNDGNETQKPFRSLVGCLNFIAARTHLGIMHVINVLSRVQVKPSYEHYAIAKKVLKISEFTCNQAHTNILFMHL